MTANDLQCSRTGPTLPINPEIEAFIAANRRTVLFVKGSDGVPRGWPFFRFYRPGTLFFTTYKKSPKVRHLEAVSTATAVVLTDYHAEPVCYAAVSGELRVSDITPATAEMITRYGMESPTNAEGVSEAVRARFRDRVLAGKRVLIELDLATAQLFQLQRTQHA